MVANYKEKLQKQKLNNKAKMKIANLCCIFMTLAKISVDKNRVDSPGNFI